MKPPSAPSGLGVATPPSPRVMPVPVNWTVTEGSSGSLDGILRLSLAAPVATGA